MNNENSGKSDIKLEKELNLMNDFTPPTYDEWKEQVIKDLKGASYEKKLLTKTYEDIELKPIYTKSDIENNSFTNELPGVANSLRSENAAGYVKKPWLISQELPYALAEDFNEVLVKDLERGQTAINVQLDDVTKLGYDADYGKEGEVGKNGLSISALRSITRAFNNVDLKKYPVYINGGFSALPISLIYAAYLKQEGYKLEEIKGSLEADPIAYTLEYGSLPISFSTAISELKQVTEWTIKNNFDVRTIGVNTLPYSNNGASATQELAYAFATAIEYINQLSEKGLSPEQSIPKFRFTFGVTSNYFMEIAKFRAARFLWNKITKAYGVEGDKAALNIHARTSVFTQTVHDPYVNMLRTTTQAFSAVVGGVDSLHTNHFDELFGLPSDLGRRISRNTQIILDEESHLTSLIDPAGGSYYIETLTNEVAEKAWSEMQAIEKAGGMLKSVEDGVPQFAVEEVLNKKKKDLAKRKSVLVGTNMYSNLGEDLIVPRPPYYQVIYYKRADYLKKFRTSGDNAKHITILEKLQTLADTDKTEEIYETGINALLEGATMGELTKSFRSKTEEEFKLPTIIKERAANLFEELRKASADYKEKNGSAPKVFLANMGPVKQHKGRADFSRGFFEVGGFEVIYSNSLNSTDDAVKAANDSDAKVIVICSTDDTYPELVPVITKGIKEKSSEVSVILAGYPKDQIEDHKNSGVDDFIFLGADAHKILESLLIKIGAM